MAVADKLRRVQEAKRGASQPGVKAELQIRERRLAGEKPPGMNAGQLTALRYAAGQGGPGASPEKQRQAKAARAKLREQLGQDVFD